MRRGFFVGLRSNENGTVLGRQFLLRGLFVVLGATAAAARCGTTCSGHRFHPRSGGSPGRRGRHPGAEGIVMGRGINRPAVID